ncbi:MAG: fluoride efflux transporter CrcB [Betaproteobacteria bacterium]
MSLLSISAVFGGAGVGACLRWWLGAILNPLVPLLPMGTLTANLLGGLLVGTAVAFFSHDGGVAPEWRLLIITGFLGGLTTFSTFSAEVVGLIGRSEYLWAMATAGAHLAGSLVLTAIGLFAATALFARH